MHSQVHVFSIQINCLEIQVSAATISNVWDSLNDSFDFLLYLTSTFQPPLLIKVSVVLINSFFTFFNVQNLFVISFHKYSVGQEEEACLLGGFLILPSPLWDGKQGGLEPGLMSWYMQRWSLAAAGSCVNERIPSPRPFKWLLLSLLKTEALLSSFWRKGFMFPFLSCALLEMAGLKIGLGTSAN